MSKFEYAPTSAEITAVAGYMHQHAREFVEATWSSDQARKSMVLRNLVVATNACVEAFGDFIPDRTDFVNEVLADESYGGTNCRVDWTPSTWVWLDRAVYPRIRGDASTNIELIHKLASGACWHETQLTRAA